MNISKEDIEKFYLEFETPLYNFALRWVWNPALAQDIVQDAFVKIWQKRDQVNKKTLKGLLYKTVQNFSLNEIRKRKLRQAVPLGELFFNLEKNNIVT